MNKKLLVIISGIILLCFIYSVTSYHTKNRDNDLKVQDYIPSKLMIKEYRGGFEGGGTTHTIDLIKDNKIQIKIENDGANVILIYEITEEKISRIYSQEVNDELLDKNYIDIVEPEENKIILKSPIKLGTTWIDNRSGQFEITGVNIAVKTPVGIFDSIEVTYNIDDFEMISYYGEKVGLIKRISGDHELDMLIGIKYLED